MTRFQAKQLAKRLAAAGWYYDTIAQHLATCGYTTARGLTPNDKTVSKLLLSCGVRRRFRRNFKITTTSGVDRVTTAIAILTNDAITEGDKVKLATMLLTAS